MTEKRRAVRVELAGFALGALAAVVMLLGGVEAPRRILAPSALDPVPSSSASDGETPWHAAARRVIEDRGEPAGRQAKVEVPSQLKHYSDSRRFLAIQVAEWKEHSVRTPHDYAGLASLIRTGELVEVPSATESYILYGVGALADTEPFTHYDKPAGKSVVILDEAGLEGERARLNESAASLNEEIKALEEEAAALAKSERTRRNTLRAEAAKKQKALKSERERLVLLESFYGDANRRRRLDAEREDLAALASGFNGRRYDLSESDSRKEMKVRMLAHLRPEALAVMEELADSYRAKFGRPLPVTSLVRPDEYQHRLSKSNSNATRIETPPHSTGLAFDILYRYMTAEEQQHVMSDIARLRDEGRVEALRENRDHFHVFAFVDGRRPGEDLIAGSLGRASAKAAEPAEAEPKKAEPKRVEAKKAEVKKAEPKKAAAKKTAVKAAVKKAAKTPARKRR